MALYPPPVSSERPCPANRLARRQGFRPRAHLALLSRWFGPLRVHVLLCTNTRIVLARLSVVAFFVLGVADFLSTSVRPTFQKTRVRRDSRMAPPRAFVIIGSKSSRNRLFLDELKKKLLESQRQFYVDTLTLAISGRFPIFGRICALLSPRSLISGGSALV